MAPIGPGPVVHHARSILLLRSELGLQTASQASTVAMRKRKQLLMTSLLMGMSCMTASWAAAAPRDVTAFVEQFTSCEHFSGEEAYDVQRARFIKSQIQATCLGLAPKLRALKRKYRHDKIVSAQLSRYSDTAGGR
jgi:hypothetical protein